MSLRVSHRYSEGSTCWHPGLRGSPDRRLGVVDLPGATTLRLSLVDSQGQPYNYAYNMTVLATQWTFDSIIIPPPPPPIRTHRRRHRRCQTNSHVSTRSTRASPNDAGARDG